LIFQPPKDDKSALKWDVTNIFGWPERMNSCSYPFQRFSTPDFHVVESPDERINLPSLPSESQGNTILLLCKIPLVVIFFVLFKVVSRKASLFVVFLTLDGTQRARIFWLAAQRPGPEQAWSFVKNASALEIIFNFPKSYLFRKCWSIWMLM